ncbi:MAG: GAF domain-containing protein [Verrucomicrobiota bacterium]
MRSMEAPWDLEDVIVTPKLDGRQSRVADRALEARVTAELLRELAKAPEEFFPKLVEAVLEFSNADSAGISLLDDESKAFIWPAVAGGLDPYIGAGTPSDFGPCGTVLDRNAPVLFSHPERHFTYLKPIKPALEEVLLVPFHVNGKAMGTIWAVIHVAGRQFDREDRRFLESLSHFAATAYRVLTETGVLKTIIARLPKHPAPQAEV